MIAQNRALFFVFPWFGCVKLATGQTMGNDFKKRKAWSWLHEKRIPVGINA
jgi:hypothetical protein